MAPRPCGPRRWTSPGSDGPWTMGTDQGLSWSRREDIPRRGISAVTIAGGVTHMVAANLGTFNPIVQPELRHFALPDTLGEVIFTGSDPNPSGMPEDLRS